MVIVSEYELLSKLSDFMVTGSNAYNMSVNVICGVIHRPQYGYMVELLDDGTCL